MISFIFDLCFFICTVVVDYFTLRDMGQMSTSEGSDLLSDWTRSIHSVWILYGSKILLGLLLIMAKCSKRSSYMESKLGGVLETFLCFFGAFVTFHQVFAYLAVWSCSFYVKQLYSVAAKYRFLWVTLKAIVQGHLWFGFPEVQKMYKKSPVASCIYILLCPCPLLSVALAALYSLREYRDQWRQLKTNKGKRVRVFLSCHTFMFMVATYWMCIISIINLAISPLALSECNNATLGVGTKESYLVLNGTVDSGQLLNLTGHEIPYNDTINGVDFLEKNLATASTNCTSIVSRDAEPFFAVVNDTSECNFTISIALNTATLIPKYNFGILMVSNGFEHCLETEMDNPTVPFSWQRDFFNLVSDAFGPECDRCNNTNMAQLLNKNILPFVPDHSNNVPFFACSSSLECTAGWTNMSALNLRNILLVEVMFDGNREEAVYDKNLPTCLRDTHATDIESYGLFVPLWSFIGIGVICFLVSVYQMHVEVRGNCNFNCEICKCIYNAKYDGVGCCFEQRTSESQPLDDDETRSESEKYVVSS